MKTTKSTPTPPLIDVLEEFASTYTTPNAKHLSKYVHSYPQYAKELAELAIELATDTNAVCQKTDCAANDDVLQMISQFQNRLHEVRKDVVAAAKTETDTVQIANPFVSFSRDRIREFTRALNANSVFFMKLRDRQISRESMSDGFLAEVAKLLNASVPGLTAFFSGEPLLAESTSYKSDRKPEIGRKESFEAAVRNSNLTQEQQDFLLKL